MLLAAANVRFTDERCKGAIEERGVAGAKGVRVRRGSEAHDPEQAWIIHAPGENQMAFEPAAARHDCHESHPGQKNDPRFLWNDLYGTTSVDQLA
jgi:hypothetical protein